jgi:hypothetical protein
MRSRLVECYDTKKDNVEDYDSMGFYKNQLSCYPHHELAKNPCYKAPPGVIAYDTNGKFNDQTRCSPNNKEYGVLCYRPSSDTTKDTSGSSLPPGAIVTIVLLILLILGGAGWALSGKSSSS